MTEKKKRFIEDADAVFAKDLLDEVKTDLPNNIWSLKSDVSKECVTLRNLLWPGYLSYQMIDQPEFGYAYFGNGVKNVEISLYL